jgi:hypothetical protein
MRNRLAGLALVLLASLSIFSVGRAAEPPPLDLKGVRVLVASGYFDLLNIPAVRRLKAAGAEVRQGDLAALTWEQARQYHLMIAVAQSPDPKTGEKAAQALERFVQAGGGLLFFRHYFGAEKADAWLAPFGASMPWELVQDPAHTFRSPTGFALSYAYTDCLAKEHPITQGATGIWYSAGKTFLFHTSPVQVSADWTVLASAAPEASSVWVGGLHEEHLSKPGRFARQPPILAAREYGRGSVVLVGISPMEVFYGQGLPAYLDIAMEKGDGLRPSGLRRLYENALRWLAARAKASDQVGQGALKPIENSWEKPQVYDWSKDLFGGDLCKRPARGVIGLHSTLSDGKSSPEAMIAKARSLGLQWVAFTERLENFAPANWEVLRRTCKAASTPEFAPLPGLDYADHSGTRWVAFGDFDWPPEKVFSDDKKRIIQPMWWFNVDCVPNGPYDIGHAPLRPWDLSMYDFFPLQTTVAGKRLDEAADSYRYVHGVQDDPFPMAVEMCYDEAQLATASGRMGTFITQDQPGDLTRFFRERSYYGSWRGFVSDGPIVTDWRAVNASRLSGAKWWAPGTEQYRVRLSARSAAAIADVRIYDGPALLRRFRPNQAAFAVTFDLPHDQQRNLTAEIIDAEGKRAITGGLCIQDHLNWRFMCGDRGNSICDGVQSDEAGAYMTGPTAPYQRKMTTFGVCAGYGERHFNILPPDFDGGMRPVGLHITPWFQAPGYTLAPPDATLEARMGVPLSSRDGLLQHDEVVGYFPGPADAWSPKKAPKDIEGVKIRYRYLDITPRAGDPGVVLVEGSLKFERPMKLDSLNVFSIFHSSQPGEGDHYALVTPDASVAGVAAGEAFDAAGRMAPGSYGCVFPSLWGSAGLMALDEGYVMSLRAKSPSVHFGVQRADMPREVKAGETLHYRYVLMHGRAGEHPNTADWERFARTMGFRGRPAYEVKEVKAGQVRGQKFLLELEAAEGAFVGTVTAADLPLRLPVRVAGVNAHWTFGWFDLDRKEWHPSAIDRDLRQGFFTLDTRRGHHRLFAGHPVLADNAAARIAVFSDGKSEVRAAVNNVGDSPAPVTLRLNPALGEASERVVLAPGELKTVTFRMVPGTR